MGSNIVSGVEPRARSVGRVGPGEGTEIAELSIDNGRLRVSVLTYGATIVAVDFPDRRGDRHNVVARLRDLAAYAAAAERAYVGSTMGRFARIVPYGLLELDGRRHHLAPNAGPHHIHGGPTGFDARVWTGEMNCGAESGRIVMSHTSPDGDQGYPGDLSCRAVFEIDRSDRLTVSYEATTDQPTLCGLSNHVFWNLSGAGTIDTQLLRVDSGWTLEAGPDFVPTGELIPVADTKSDFRFPRRLQGVTIDDFFVLPTAPSSPLSSSSRAEPRGVRTVAELFDPHSGRVMVVGTDQSGMALYTGDFLPVARAGICLQPGPWPHAPSFPAFPPSVLRPEQVYRSRTTFDFALTEVPPHG